jgi:hypothetical protein
MKSSGITILIFACAIHAVSLVNTDGSPALRTLPLFMLTFRKCFKSKISDALEVHHQAGIVFGPVPFIQLQHSLTGIFRAFVTEFGICFCQVTAVQYDAVYPARQFRYTFQTASHAFVLFAQIGHAGSAIHSTRGNEDRVSIRYFRGFGLLVHD